LGKILSKKLHRKVQKCNCQIAKEPQFFNNNVLKKQAKENPGLMSFHFLIVKHFYAD